MVPALRRLAQISAVFFVSHVTTGTIRNVLACQTRSTPDLGPVMKAGAVRSVSTKEDEKRRLSDESPAGRGKVRAGSSGGEMRETAENTHSVRSRNLHFMVVKLPVIRQQTAVCVVSLAFPLALLSSLLL